MIRITTMAALALALMSSAAFAQADRPPAELSGGPSYDDRAPNAPPPNAQSYDDRYGDRDYDDRNYDDRDAPPPASAQNNAQDRNTAQNNDRAPDPQRDIYCRRSAAASTGYVTPGQAADHEQAAGSIGGAVGGAALGAIIGGASHAAGPGALIGAGAGLLAGTAIGSSNARHAAADVQAAYSDAYYACMAGNDVPPPDARYAYGPPPPPPAYYAPYPYAYPYPYYYGPAVRLNFGWGGGRGWHHRHR
jgi:opacity protein-like surface antigen